MDTIDDGLGGEVEALEAQGLQARPGAQGHAQAFGRDARRTVGEVERVDIGAPARELVERCVADLAAVRKAHGLQVVAAWPLRVYGCAERKDRRVGDVALRERDVPKLGAPLRDLHDALVGDALALREIKVLEVGILGDCEQRNI